MTIHHIDGDPRNNDIENLEYIPDPGENRDPHKQDRFRYLPEPCPTCGRECSDRFCGTCGKSFPWKPTAADPVRVIGRGYDPSPSQVQDMRDAGRT